MSTKSDTAKRAARASRSGLHARDARERFLASLAAGMSVTAACEAAGVSRRHAYDHRAENETFEAEWDAALEQGTDRLEDEARRRAFDGVDEPIVSLGKIARDDDGNILKIRKYSDTLLITLLKARRPDKYRERVATELTGRNGAPVAFSKMENLTDEQLAAIAAGRKP